MEKGHWKCTSFASSGRFYPGYYVYEYLDAQEIINSNTVRTPKVSITKVNSAYELRAYIGKFIDVHDSENFYIGNKEIYEKLTSVNERTWMPWEPYSYDEYKFVIDNNPPTISGNDLDLGSKTDDFSIEYLVSDSDNDACTIDIFVDNVKKISSQGVSLNTKYNYQVKMGDFTLGRHTIRITATDSKGASATRTYTFTKSNTAPIISGSDRDLGGKSTAFTENYRVSDKNNDVVAVTITLDDLEIANLSSAQDKDLSFTITDSQLLAMEIGSTHTVTIKADDGKGGVAYRRYTFTKINRPPIISGADANLGQKKTEFTQSFSFTDVEKDKIYCRVYLDGRKVYENLEVVDSKTYSYRIPHEEFIQLRYGKHEIKIEAWDDYSMDKKEYRVYSFERISNGLEVEVKINEFTVQPKKIIAVPHGIFASDAIMKVYACNNYMDSSPTWEDISAESKAARAHTFTNTSKSNSKWSIGIKVIVENGKSGVGSVLRGIKGGYE